MKKRYLWSGLVALVFVIVSAMAADTPLQTIVEPSAEAQQIRLYNTQMRRSNHCELIPSQKFAICIVELNPAVVQPTDYSTLKTQVEAIVGIQRISLLVDGQCPASIPEGKQLVGYVEAHLRIDDLPTP